MSFWGRFRGRTSPPKFYLIPYEATNSEKKFWPKNFTSNPPNDMNLQYISLLWTKFWNEIEFVVLPPGGQDFQGPFLAVLRLFWTAINHSPLVVEFKTKYFFQNLVYSNELYCKVRSFGGLEVPFLSQNIFFRLSRFIR